MKGIAIGLLLLLVCVAGCIGVNTVTAPEASNFGYDVPSVDGVVSIVITDTGASTDMGSVTVDNFHADGRAEMVYRIYNKAQEPFIPVIQPLFYADPTDWDKTADAIKLPEYAWSWVEIPVLTSILSGESKDFIVAIEMPKDAKKPAEKIAYKLFVGKMVGFNMQLGVETWWILNMR